MSANAHHSPTSAGIKLELAPYDAARLRLLAPVDVETVLDLARLTIHRKLDELIAEPACPVCPRPSGQGLNDDRPRPSRAHGRRSVR